MLVFKDLNGFAPPIFKEYINQITGRNMGTKSDCYIPLIRSTFSQFSFAFRGTHECNILFFFINLPWDYRLKLVNMARSGTFHIDFYVLLILLVAE